jgi:pimeloyl-ACP methyl ester carboxylesterase
MKPGSERDFPLVLVKTGKLCSDPSYLAPVIPVIEAALANIASPTLVLWGDCDRTYTWSQQLRLWQGIKGARLAVIPGCAHAVHLEKPKLFNAILADFLEAEG